MGELFNFEDYEIGIAVIGLVMLLAAWIPQLFLKRHVTLPFLHLTAGFLLFKLAGFEAMNPYEEDSRWVWEKLTEVAVIISLLGAGLKIDEPLEFKTWKPTFQLLLITMPLTILGVVGLGYWFVGLPIASAVLLGAVLAPTDPVMAADVQVGPPRESSVNEVRFPLTSEAGLNDSLAFPFTYLAICLAQYGWNGEEAWLMNWIWKAVFYKVIMGCAVGIGLGYLLSKIIFKYPTEKPLAREGLGCIALSVLFLSYGVTELVGGYGFLAVFVCAIRLRRAVANHDYHNILYEFSENLERSAMALILFLFGGLITLILPALDWKGILVGLTVIFLIRPLGGYLGLLGYNRPFREKATIAFFGIRGIGSVYYLAYALGMASFAESEWIWATVLFIITLSSVIHSLLAIPVMQKIDGE